MKNLLTLHDMHGRAMLIRKQFVVSVLAQDFEHDPACACGMRGGKFKGALLQMAVGHPMFVKENIETIEAMLQEGDGEEWKGAPHE